MTTLSHPRETSILPIIMFPRSGMMKKLPDPIFETEFDAAQELNFRCLLFAEDVIDREGMDVAIDQLPNGQGDTLLYRGWIMTHKRYQDFFQAMAKKGYRLVTDPSQYELVSYFPKYYALISDYSPPAVWTHSADPYEAWTMSHQLGGGPYVLKDHIKSAKNRWNDACFVPANADRVTFETVARNLVNEQGILFHRGFVIKKYVSLKSCGLTFREYPQAEEYRLFFWNQKLLFATPYHDFAGPITDWSEFESVAQRIPCPFFSMDVAVTDEGRSIIVDMGAGECSSRPPSLSATEFISRLKERIFQASS